MAKKLTPGRPMERGDLGLSEYGPAIEPKRPPRPRPMEPGDIGLSEYGSYKRGDKVANYCKGGKVISSRKY